MPQTKKGPTVRPAGPSPDTNLNHRRNKDNTLSEGLREISPLGKAALRYAAQGFRVFPCVPRDKGPITPNGHKNATTDPEKIRTWWTKRPQANIGLVPDPGTAIVDVDPQHDGDKTFDLIPSKARARMKNTLIAQSGGGGWHYILKDAPLDLKGGLGKGIDLKRHGKGYVVVAPSIHPNGKKYRWVEGFDPERIKAWPTKSLAPYIASLQPEDKPTKTPNKERGELTPGQLKKILAKMDVDSYDDWIAAGQAFRGDLGEEGYDLWDEWSKTSTKYPGPGEAKRKWRSFNGKGRGIGSLVHQIGGKLSSPEPEEEFTKVPLEPGEVRSTSGLDVTGFGQIEEKRVDWLVPGYVARGVLHCVAGYGGEGKSSALSALISAVTRGKSWVDGADLPDGPVSVVMITEEPIAYQTKPRLRLAGADLDRVFNVNGIKTSDGKMQPWNLVDHEKKTRSFFSKHSEVQLLVIDPIGNYMSGEKREINTWKDSDVRIALSPWQKVAEDLNIAIIYIAHHAKGKADRAMNLVTGSAAFTTVTRMSYAVVKPPNGYLIQFGFGDNAFGEDDDKEDLKEDLGSERIMFPTKVNIGPAPKPVVIRFDQVKDSDNPKVSVLGVLPRISAEELMNQMRAIDTEEKSDAPLQDRILEYVTENPGQTKNAICAAVGSSPTNEGTQKAFTMLEKKNKIKVVTIGPRMLAIYPIGHPDIALFE